MRRPDVPDIAIVIEDIGCKLLDSKWTPIVLVALVAFAFGFLLGVEIVRSFV